MPSLPTDARLPDAQAMQTLKEVAAEFASFNAAASGRVGARDPTSILTSVLAEAIDRSHTGFVTRADRPQQPADAFAAHLVWLAEAALLPGRGYLLKTGAQTSAPW